VLAFCKELIDVGYRRVLVGASCTLQRLQMQTRLLQEQDAGADVSFDERAGPARYVRSQCLIELEAQDHTTENQQKALVTERLSRQRSLSLQRRTQ
jgi:hypothetical protein